MDSGDVASRLRHWGGSSVRAERLLVNAISRLPEDVREAALDECVFVTIGRDDGGFYIPAGFVSKSWVVVLNEDWSDEDFESAVAHELAHLSLKHPPADLFLDVAKNEDDAAARGARVGLLGDRFSSLFKAARLTFGH